MANIGIFYGSTEGNTERVVNKLQTVFGGEAAAELVNVASASASDFENYQHIILACPTWEIGELQEDWDNFIDELDEVEWEGKNVAFLGVGDAIGYPDTFVDAMGILYNKIKSKGCNFVGAWPTDGYQFEDSKGLVNGKFIGLAIDEDNQSELTDKRLQKWVEQLKPVFLATVEA